MDGIWSMLRLNMKLLFRNKGYLCFLVLLPLLSVLLLNLPLYGANEEKEGSMIFEVEQEQATLNIVNDKMGVLVYDCSQSVASKGLIEDLADMGTYIIFLVKSEPLSLEEAKIVATEKANRSSVRAILYIPEDFDAKIQDMSKGELNDQEPVTLFEVSGDERLPILYSNTNKLLQNLSLLAKTAGDKENFESMLLEKDRTGLKKEVVLIESTDGTTLTTAMKSKISNVGYSLAIVSMGFLFSGVFIASIVVEEKQNKVFTRIRLTSSKLYGYYVVKLILTFVTVVIQTAIMGIGMFLFVKTDYGIPFGSYLYFVFCIGLIFNLLSVVAGILMNDTLCANYLAFFVWSLSCMFAGLYFPISAASKWWERVSLLMPQRWVIKVSEMVMLGKTEAYSVMFLVLLTFLTVILCVGVMGSQISTQKE